MKDNFDLAVGFILKWEGEWGEVPGDRGGPTRWGISQRAFPDVDLQSLTRDGAKALYLAHYWVPAHCDLLVYPLDIAVFNIAVTSGVRRSVQIREASDGTFADFVIQCYKFYVSIPGQVLEGWLNRLYDLYQTFKTGGTLEQVLGTPMQVKGAPGILNRRYEYGEGVAKRMFEMDKGGNSEKEVS